MAITGASTLRAQTSDPLKVMIFPTASHLGLFAADSQGFFAKHGLNVEILFTPNSTVLRDGLAQGRHQIVHTGVDNAVAMADVAKVDIAVIIGGDNGFNQLFAQQDIKSLADLRGKTVIVDSPNTAFALLLYKMLAQSGLQRDKDYFVKAVGGVNLRLQTMEKDKSAAAAMLNLPYNILARRAELKDMGWAVDVVGPYQSTAGFVLRSWAKDNGEILVRYLQAYIHGLRWAVDPANKAQAVALLSERLKLPQDVASETYDLLADPAKGIAKDAKFNVEGFRNVLQLRADMLGTWGGKPPAPDKYLDFSYYEKALAQLK